MKLSKVKLAPKVSRFSKLKLLAIFFIVICTLGVIKFKPLTIKEVEITPGNFNCGSGENVKVDLKLENKLLFLIKELEVKKIITEKYFCISDIKIKYIFPKKITIELLPRTPLVKAKEYQATKLLDLANLEASPSSTSALLDWSIPANAGKEIYLIDDSGVVFGVYSETNLPLVYIADQQLALGQRIGDRNFSNISQIFTKLPALEVDFSQTKMVGNSYQILAKPQIVFNLEKDALRQLASLQLILSKAKIDSKVVEVVDLRFDKPVVIYSQDVKKR